MEITSVEPRSVHRGAGMAIVDSDFDLLDRWRAGDNAAGHALLARHFDVLRRFFVLRCGQDADDLVQRTMLACVASKDRFRKHASFRTYMFVVARNELYRYIAVRRRDGERFELSGASSVEAALAPGSRANDEAELQRVVAALHKLPDHQRTLLELHYWSELGIAALSELFEVGPGNIRTKLHRARRKLRDLLALSEDDAADPREPTATTDRIGPS